MMTLFLSKVWSALKPHIPGMVFALFVVSTFFGAYYYFKRENQGLVGKMQELHKIHEDELKSIKSAQALERKQREENLKTLQKALDDAKADYDKKIKDLEEKKGKEVTGLVNTWRTDPSGAEMAKKLGQITGFKVLIPEKK